MDKQSQIDRVVGLLQKPMTIEELIDELGGGNYYTVYRLLKELKADELVEEMPFRKDRKIVWVATGSPKKGVITLKSRIAGSQPATAYMKLTTVHVTNLMRGALAYLWRRSYHYGDPTKWGGDFAPIHVKEHVRFIRKACADYVLLCDQLLAADVWKDSGGVHEKLGPVGQLIEIMEAAEFYEAWAREKG